MQACGWPRRLVAVFPVWRSEMNCRFVCLGMWYFGVVEKVTTVDRMKKSHPVALDALLIGPWSL